MNGAEVRMNKHTQIFGFSPASEGFLAQKFPLRGSPTRTKLLHQVVNLSHFAETKCTTAVSPIKSQRVVFVGVPHAHVYQSGIVERLLNNPTGYSSLARLEHPHCVTLHSQNG
jgi:hypothetical protein